jgi:hypothetical protein
MRSLRYVALLSVIVLFAVCLPAQTRHLAEDVSVFPNPERGFYFYQQLDRLDASVNRLRDGRGITLIWGKISLGPFRTTREIPADFIADLERGFELAQEAGAKVIVRGEYGHAGPGGDYTTYEDPALEIIEAHIAQLAPLFARNADRIAFFEAGFVGPWGEWHGTKIAREPALQRRVYLHLLKNTPPERMVLLRYPALKQSIFETARPLDARRAYDGSPEARTGHHNDCFLSSANDVGTYNRDGLNMADEIAYLHAETRHTLFGGETCGLHERGERESALHELEYLHASYLNAAYHPDVLKRWRENGVLDVVERRLGARFVATAFEVPAKGRPGEKFRIRFSIANKGFAALYNARPAALVLIAADGRRHRFPIATDTRHWKAGETVELVADINLPHDLAVGGASWALHLPDASARLAADPRFSYRLANVDAWDAETGENRLVIDWPVTR